MMEKTATLRRQALAFVRDLADEGRSTQETAQLVDIGHALWSISDEADRAIAPIKESLRQTAKQHNEENVLIKGASGHSCKVTLPKPNPFVKDAGSLRAVLGESFDLLFDTVTTYKVRSDFAERLLTLPSDQQQAILRRMVFLDPTPRVSFKIRE